MSLILCTCFLLTQGQSAKEQERLAEELLPEVALYYKTASSADSRAPMAARRVQTAVVALALHTDPDALRKAVERFEKDSHFSIDSHQVAWILFNVVFNDPKPGSPLAFAKVDLKHARISWSATPLGGEFVPMYTQWDKYRKKLGFRPKEQLKMLAKPA